MGGDEGLKECSKRRGVGWLDVWQKDDPILHILGVLVFTDPSGRLILTFQHLVQVTRP